MTLAYKSIRDADLKGKRVLLRAGFDVPIENGVVSDTTRIDAIAKTMQYILDHGASLIIMAHQGRPKDAPDLAFSQKPLVSVLEKLLSRKVLFAESCIGEGTKKVADALQPGDVLLLENLRFYPEEKKNSPAFADSLAKLADIYVQDAFSNSHRNHASMVGVAERLPSFMGLQLEEEVTHLDKILNDTAHPVVLILGGAKLETKIPLLSRFLEIGDHILLGGAIANTFLLANGVSIGKSKFDQEGVDLAKELLKKSGTKGCATIHLPEDGVLAESPDGASRITAASDTKSTEAIFDVGPKTLTAFRDIIQSAKMIIWNGPVGYFEVDAFSNGSKEIAKAISDATKKGAMSVIGGGDTIDVHSRYHLPITDYSFVSMGGGAMLEYLSGKELASIRILKR